MYGMRSIINRNVRTSNRSMDVIIYAITPIRVRIANVTVTIRWMSLSCWKKAI
jgi:hypothetical protein